MGYKYSKGAQVIGDLKAQDDTQRDTLIDFGEDYIGLETSGSVRMVISGSDGKVGIGSTSPSHKLDINGDIRIRGNDIRDNSGNPAITFDGSANTTIVNILSFEDTIMTELSIPDVDLQTDTNANTFNAPYALTFEKVDLYLDQESSSGNVTVTVKNVTADPPVTIFEPSISSGVKSGSDTTAVSGSVSAGTRIRLAITAAGTNAQGLRANIAFKRDVT